MESMVGEQQLKNYYSGKKVFVTGHTGFKGAWLCAWLHKLGANVQGFALPSEDDQSIYNFLKPIGIFHEVIGDIRDKKTLFEAIIVFEPDFIFHLAAQSLVRKSYSLPGDTFEINTTGTANLLEAVIALKKKCSVVIITTDKVYENIEQDILYTEEDRLGGYDPYSASKACAEIVVSSFRNSFFNIKAISQHNKAIASARAGNVIGGGDFNNSRILPDIVKSLKNDEVIKVRNPSSIRPWQHVLESLGGYLLLGGLLDNNPQKFSGAYNFGPELGDHLTVKELVQLAISTWGKGEWQDCSDITEPHEAQLLKLNINKAKQQLGWSPKLSAATAIEWTINWYKQKPSEIPAYTFAQINRFMEL